MYWSDIVAEKLKERNLPLEWVDDMKTPSGRIHIGSLRGVVVHDLIYKSLKDTGVPAKYTYLFESSDPMDDLPSYLPKETFEQYLGMPLFMIPSPEPGYKNYAEYFALEFKRVFNAIGCEPEIIWTADLYTSGKMNDDIKRILDHAKDIRMIYEELYKKPLKDDWYPYQVYCEQCNKVVTTRVYDWDGENVSYRCIIDAVKWTKGCGYEGKVSPLGGNGKMAGKLPWKVEWAVKWKVVGVTVEGAGKDHMSAGGSHDLASLVCKRVLDYPIPYPVPYEFILVGGRKMSSSKGRGTPAAEMLDILPPVLLRFLMVRAKINQQINFDPTGDTIPKLFDEYQRAADAYFNKTDTDLARVFELSQIGEIQKPPSIRFSVLAQWVQMPNMEETIKKEGLEEWAAYAKIWVEKYAPESERFLVQKETPVEAFSLSAEQKQYLKQLGELVDRNISAEELQLQMYELAKSSSLSPKDAFGAVYLSLIGKNHGPKAAWLLSALDKTFVKERFEHVVTHKAS